jgi:hypothetical protein
MLTEYIYKPLGDKWDEKIKDCCAKPDPEIPKGSDCCYDTWTEELKEVNKAYKKAEEEAKQKSAEFSYVSERRDQFKKWYDELTKANELEQAICDQLEILYGQAEKVGKNTQFTVDAIKILFCMVRDYYLQLDLIKEKYDALISCTQCLNNPALASGTGLMKLFEDFGKKLEAAQASRDDLLRTVMAALALAEKIDLNIAEDDNEACPDYGLLSVVSTWKNTLNCAENCGGSSSGEVAKKKPMAKQGLQSSSDECATDDCELKPMFYLPICKDTYYSSIKIKYDEDKAEAESLSKELLDLNKKKESLLACKQSLEAAIKEVNPKERCK